MIHGIFGTVFITQYATRASLIHIGISGAVIEAYDPHLQLVASLVRSLASRLCLSTSSYLLRFPLVAEQVLSLLPPVAFIGHI